MNDPHVEVLYYDFVSENPGDHFDEAAPLAESLGPFIVGLHDGVLKARPKNHYPDEESAKAALGPCLRSWEAAALLSEGRFRIRFIFRTADIIDRNPDPDVTTINVKTIATSSVDAKATIVRDIDEYPAPDSNFQASPLIGELISLLKESRDGRLRIGTLTNLVLGKLQNEYGNRKEASKKLHVSREVLNTLGKLGASTDPEHGRKAQGSGPGELSSTQLQWLDAVVVRLVYRVGEINAGTSLTQITMKDFPKM